MSRVYIFLANLLRGTYEKLIRKQAIQLTVLTFRSSREKHFSRNSWAKPGLWNPFCIARCVAIPQYSQLPSSLCLPNGSGHEPRRRRAWISISRAELFGFIDKSAMDFRIGSTSCLWKSLDIEWALCRVTMKRIVLKRRGDSVYIVSIGIVGLIIGKCG